MHTHHEDMYWTPIIKNLHQLSNKPCCCSVTQQLMFKNQAAVNKASKTLYGEVPTMSRNEWLNKRNEVARKLVETEFKADFEGL